MAQWLTNETYGSGLDGAITYSGSGSDTTPNTTASGTSGTTSLTVGSGTGFANNNIVFIHQSRNGGSGAGAWELNVISSVGGGTNWTMKYALSNSYATTAQVYLLKQYNSVTINNGVTLTATAWDGSKGGIVAFLCNGTTTINGTINGRFGYRPGSATVGSAGNQAEGTNGTLDSSSTAANGNGGGGGSAGVGQSGGGGGGNGASGSNGSGPGAGIGGETAGNSSLTTMVFGGGGGSGSGNGSNLSGAGGIGGGVLLIISQTLTMGGSSNVTFAGSNGNPGAGGTASAGGGGGGGSILIKGQTISLGNSLVLASGGNGGVTSVAGGNGGTGRIHIDYVTSVSGTTNPTFTSTVDGALGVLQFGSII